MAFAIARIAKQKGGSVGSSSLHNGRGRETPNADPAREKDNRVILGQENRSTPEMVREIIAAHGGKPRRDSVEAVEVLLTASPEWWRDDKDEIDREKVDRFCVAAREFLTDRKNGGICVKAVLHMDEHTPHIHGHMVPIDPEGKLSCKHYFGTRWQLARWQDRFAELVKPLGLERGVEGSRARHIDIKDFYKAIEREHRIMVDYEKLPDPPKMCMTKESAQKFKEEFSQALIKQIEKPIQTQLHQAMLARDSHNKQKETKKRLFEVRAEFAHHKHTVVELQAENEQVRNQAHDALQRAEKAETRVQDVDHAMVMKLLGYSGVPDQQRGTIDFHKPETNLLVSVFPGAVYDRQMQIVARNSVKLIQEVMKREGKQISRTDAVGWLADQCGHDRAKAASMAEHEQEIEGHLHDRQKERGMTTVAPTRDERLTRPEPERVHDRGVER